MYFVYFNYFIYWEQFITVCHLRTEHCVVCRITVSDWRIELYDSFYFKYEPDQSLLTHRTVKLLSLTRLFPSILVMMKYCENNKMIRDRGTEFMQLVFMPVDAQFCQVDGVNCEVYNCMYMDMLFRKKKEATRDIMEEIKKSRTRIVRRIFKLRKKIEFFVF